MVINLISYENAKSLIRKNVKKLSVKKVDLLDSIGCVLAEDIYTKTPIPTYDSSAVDGFAVNLSDISSASSKNQIKLKIQNTIQAGDIKKYILKPKHTFKIFTGAVVPENVNTILMKESVSEKKGYIIVTKPTKLGENIRIKGEEFKDGALILKKNTFITPPVVGMLASLGIAKVSVIRKPRVSIIVTGNELKRYDASLKLGQVRDSNAPAIFAALNSLGIKPVSYQIIKDELHLTTKALREVEKISDLIITAGGVSVGERDYVREAAKRVGFKEIYWQIAIKPGKPNYFAVKGGKLLFGLPGNPVAAIVSFHNLVKLAISLLMGYLPRRNEVLKAKLLYGLRKKERRLEFVRAYLYKDETGSYLVAPTIGQGSHMIGGLVKANCFIKFPRNASFLPRGTLVDVVKFEWNNLV